MSERIAVIGAGSWGTALAKLLAEAGRDVVLWAFEEEVSSGINRDHRNPLYLSEVVLPSSLKATSNAAEALDGREFVVSVVPSSSLRAIWTQYGRFLGNDAVLVSCTKGIEEKGLKLMNEVLAEVLPDHPKERIVVLSGPSFAKEVAAGLPTSVVIAGGDLSIAKRVQELFRTETFLTFVNDDVIGVEVGGAVKNVIALASGISDGLGLGNNTRATIITRGLYEMIKIGNALGANPLTFTGLSGIGDLVLTCTANISRNYTAGFELGSGRTLDEVVGSMRMSVEGIPTTRAVYKLAHKEGINVPICAYMFRILFEGLSPKQAVSELCSMELRNELGSIINS
jgi:glycerol-3-phosphate dehydrogenase (NAD(P)+)